MKCQDCDNGIVRAGSLAGRGGSLCAECGGTGEINEPEPPAGSEIEFWWVPQVPMTSFSYPVPSIAHGRMLEDAFAKYYLFQLEHNVKPDYCNTGGIRWKHPAYTEGEWWDYDREDMADILENVVLAFAKLVKPEEK